MTGTLTGAGQVAPCGGVWRCPQEGGGESAYSHRMASLAKPTANYVLYVLFTTRQAERSRRRTCNAW